jgi:hypothetical protein
MLSLLKRYTPPIVSFKIETYEHEPPIFRIKATILLTDESRLHIKEYRFSNGQRKYAYHWESAGCVLISRWDNTEHWPYIATFPHHRHNGCDNMIHPLTQTYLESVLKYIAGLIR